MKKFKPRNYQYTAIKHLLHNQAVIDAGGAALLMDMGLGKTVVALTAADVLLKWEHVNKILVVAPKRVAEHTWPAEIKEWDHLSHLTVSVIIGTEKERIAAINKRADIYTINRENVPWLCRKLGKKWPFDLVIIDELSSFKNGQSSRFKNFKMIRPLVKRLWGLTGTPAPNGLSDLWSQLFLIDKGARLGKTITEYRNNYLKPDKQNGKQIFSYKVRSPEAEKIIYDKIGDICISMKSEDYLDLPEKIDIYSKIPMNSWLRDAYEEFEIEMVLAMGEEEITAASAAALANKLLQFCNGAVYRPDKTYYEVHNEKILDLEEILDELDGNPLLCFYNYQHDVERITKKLRRFKPFLLPTGKAGIKAIDDWNAGKIPFLITHPASAGHGLNMQFGGHNSCWFGVPWSLELYLQANKRVHRSGQMSVVNNRHLTMKGTIEDRVIRGLSDKDKGQNYLMDSIKAIVENVRGY